MRISCSSYSKKFFHCKARSPRFHLASKKRKTRGSLPAIFWSSPMDIEIGYTDLYMNITLEALTTSASFTDIAMSAEAQLTDESLPLQDPRRATYQYNIIYCNKYIDSTLLPWERKARKDRCIMPSMSTTRLERERTVITTYMMALGTNLTTQEELSPRQAPTITRNHSQKHLLLMKRHQTLETLSWKKMMAGIL